MQPADEVGPAVAVVAGQGAELQLAQLGGDCPVLLRVERLDLALALHHQPHRHALHAPSRQAALHLAPQQRAELIAHQPVEHTPRLLRLDAVHVDGPRLGEGGADGRLGDLLEDDALGARRVHFGRLAHVPGDGLALAVGVGGQEDLVGPGRGFLQLLHQRPLLVGHAVLWREVVIDIDAQTRLQQVAHVAQAGFDHVAAAQIAADGLGLGRRLDDDQLAAALAALDGRGLLAGRFLGGRRLLARGFRGGGLLRARGDLRLGQPVVGRGATLLIDRAAADRARPARAGRAVGRPFRHRVTNNSLLFTLQAVALQFFVAHASIVPGNTPSRPAF